jgi:hypothetical protein
VGEAKGGFERMPLCIKAVCMRERAVEANDAVVHKKRLKVRSPPCNVSFAFEPQEKKTLEPQNARRDQMVYNRTGRITED